MHLAIKTSAYTSAITVSLLMFSAGTTLTWSSPEIPKLVNSSTSPFLKEITHAESTWISSVLTLGASVGPFFFGYLSDKIGRKYTLLILGVPFLASFLLMTFVKIVEVFFIARLLAGVSVGATFTLLVTYIAEIADKSNRGTLMALSTCAMIGGQLFSYCLGPYVSVPIFNFILAIFPLTFLVLFTFLGEETPYYFIRKRNYKRAKEALQKFKHDKKTSELELDGDLSAIQRSIEDQDKGSICDIFQSKGLIKALVISESLLVLQQLTGINAVVFYSQTIFSETVSNLDAQVCSIIVGFVQFLCSCCCPFIFDKFNRKFLLLLSTIGMMLCEVPLGVYSYLKEDGRNVDSLSFLPIVTLAFYIVFFMVGIGPMPWIILGELFPTRVKAIAVSSVSCTNWILGFVITKYFEDMKDAVGLGTLFWIFSGFCAFTAIFTKVYVIETRGKSLEEIQTILNK